ncbi:MAG: sulfotransferase [Candidatus Electryonea clarkiae]|nr:sulfotransferase [Candidatus Electryonea clarkiae]MDP8285979.1 sulfotransferase [Candidatus Electryonea clarkiae]
MITIVSEEKLKATQASSQAATKCAFIGGSGRSGTSILAHIFANHPDVLYFAEPRFLIDRGGVSDLVQGRIPLNEFLLNMMNTFNQKLQASLKISRIEHPEEIYSSNVMQSLIRESFNGTGNINGSLNKFLNRLFQHGVEACNKKYWLEKTPHTVTIVDVLHTIFSEMKYIHIIREPKDVACSMFRKNWGPNNSSEFVPYYHQIMNAAMKAKNQVQQENYCVVSLENLMIRPREIMRYLFDFAQFPTSDDQINTWTMNLDPEKAHIDRWKKELDPKSIQLIEDGCVDNYEYWKSEEMQI